MTHEDMRPPIGPIVPPADQVPTLDRIAAVLACPVRAFADPTPIDEPCIDGPRAEQAEADLHRMQTAEMVRLWLALSDPVARSGVLAVVRDLVARQKV